MDFAFGLVVGAVTGLAVGVFIVLGFSYPKVSASPLSPPPPPPPSRTALPALLDALDAAEARERRLREALTKCMERFGEYEGAHIVAGKFDRAARNGEMRQMCRDALADTAP